MMNLLFLRPHNLYLAQITEFGQQISDFVAKNGLLAFILVMVALVILIIFGGLVYIMVLVVRIMSKQQDASDKRDARIDRVSVKVDDVAEGQDKVLSIFEKSEVAYDKMTASMDANTDVTRSVVTSFQVIEESITKSYDATGAVIGITGNDVKKNSDQNANRIITEIQSVQKSLESEDGALRKDAKVNADRIIEQFQTLYKRNVELEAKVLLLEATNQTLQQLTVKVHDQSANPAGDDHPTEPLADPVAVALSLVDGEKNRLIIDATKAPVSDQPLEVGKSG